MTEQALFHAYRNLDGTHEADCACGGLIESPTGDPTDVADAIRLHGESPVHSQWATWQAAVHALQRPTRKPCPCHRHIATVEAA